jgi:hypothetical protein
MSYSHEVKEEILIKYGDALTSLSRTRAKCVQFVDQLKQEDAKEYLLHGVARRLGTIQKCLQNIFALYPIDTSAPLTTDIAQDTTINLQAFVINVYGIQDNLAWVFVHENEIKLNHLNVGLFKHACLELFPPTIRAFLKEDRIETWHQVYAKDYRDALAHRIPLYVPNAQLTKDEEKYDRELSAQWSVLIAKGDLAEAEMAHVKRMKLGSPAPYFLHSYRSNSYMHLHPQVIADTATVHQVTNLFLDARFAVGG